MGKVGAVVGHGVVHAQVRVALRHLASVDVIAMEDDEAATGCHWVVVAKEVHITTQNVGSNVIFDKS